MAELRLYRTYRFIEKDPIIDRMRTMVQDEGLMEKLGAMHEISGVSETTLRNWFFGDTRRPQHSTIAAIATSLGYREEFVRDHKIDIEAERKAGADWIEKQDKARERAEAKAEKAKPKKKNGHG